ncbi:hypothetical protein F2Q70_00029975 [Brassica cretica]|uniref:Uncharacterized protein n=1 Tax=Brassica cretica TaxID=69181 RepID=A0A8S9FE35_BRACR|nr:hypothetical protein F2Q70_00029975 [Brassica cretica]KAF2551357.1 hypothetical protein F2Q68_00034452 [Brassica cretica]
MNVDRFKDVDIGRRSEVSHFTKTLKVGLMSGKCCVGRPWILPTFSHGLIYARFTEEWSVCLARGSCRRDEGLSINIAALVSVDSDARMRAEHIL